MLRLKKQGFTLIELMVVIVIIGVLASLAIPRFTEASAKAKVAEAPRVLASYEGAYLAAVVEIPPGELASLNSADLVFEPPLDSKWFGYQVLDNGASVATASAKGDMGAFKAGGQLITTYTTASNGTFLHSADGTILTAATAKKFVPNFIK